MSTLPKTLRFAPVLLPACAALFITATPAFAQACYSQFDGNWHDSGIWNTSRDGTGSSCTPGDAVIQPGHTIAVDTSVACATLTIEDSASSGQAVLDLKASGVLVVSSSVDGEDDLAVPGKFNFSASSGTLGKLRAAGGRVTLDGLFETTGSLGGEFDQTGAYSFTTQSGSSFTTGSGPLTFSAPMTHNGSLTATSGSITISGALTNNGTIRSNGGSLLISAAVTNGSTGIIRASSSKITISAALTNNASGLVEADGGNVTLSADVENDGTMTAKGGTDMTFSSSSTINTGSIGLWQVTASGSDMVFGHDDSTIPSLTGDSDFNVEAGRMYFME
ncbi:MAG: hypothetical protein GY778_20130, partial [bacterium]|nr:hypothetical protein [bacterium]